MSCGVETNNSSMNGDEFIDYLVTNPNNAKVPRCKTRIGIAVKRNEGYEREYTRLSTSGDEGEVQVANENHNYDKPTKYKRMKSLSNATQKRYSLQFDPDLEPLPENKCIDINKPPSSIAENNLQGRKTEEELSRTFPVKTEEPSNSVKQNSVNVKKTTMKRESVARRTINQKELPKLNISKALSQNEFRQTRGLSVDSRGKPFSFKTAAQVVATGKQFCGLNQKELCETLRHLKTPTTVPDYIWDAHRERLNSISERNLIENKNITIFDKNTMDETTEVSAVKMFTPEEKYIQDENKTITSLGKCCEVLAIGNSEYVKEANDEFSGIDFKHTASSKIPSSNVASNDESLSEIRKGNGYQTIKVLANRESHQPLQVLTDHSSEILKGQLKKFDIMDQNVINSTEYTESTLGEISDCVEHLQDVLMQNNEDIRKDVANSQKSSLQREHLPSILNLTLDPFVEKQLSRIQQTKSNTPGTTTKRKTDEYDPNTNDSGNMESKVKQLEGFFERSTEDIIEHVDDSQKNLLKNQNPNTDLQPNERSSQNVTQNQVETHICEIAHVNVAKASEEIPNGTCQTTDYKFKSSPKTLNTENPNSSLTKTDSSVDRFKFKIFSSNTKSKTNVENLKKSPKAHIKFSNHQSPIAKTSTLNNWAKKLLLVKTKSEASESVTTSQDTSSTNVSEKSTKKSTNAKTKKNYWWR
ncbi:uncharacterized protein LOC142234220 [Haematobia irritans]|uniref:uncharacterized protein LOC142234220 n=1 Tax=Haematobia irritans TaxID=7368 RepID=UPI003F50906A